MPASGNENRKSINPARWEPRIVRGMRGDRKVKLAKRQWRSSPEVWFSEVMGAIWRWHVRCEVRLMKTITSSGLRKIFVLMGAVLVASALDTTPVRALNLPFNGNLPSPNSGVAPGHRSAGAFTARRPGNLPIWGPRPHSFTGVTMKTPGAERISP